MSDKKHQIQQQFITNRQAAFKNLIDNPLDYIGGQAEALDISYEKAAALVAFGMAMAVRNISLQTLEKETQDQSSSDPEWIGRQAEQA